MQKLTTFHSGEAVPVHSVTAGMTASTTQSQGNGALTSSFNEISTVANDDGTVTLPKATIGKVCFIINILITDLIPYKYFLLLVIPLAMGRILQLSWK